MSAAIDHIVIAGAEQAGGRGAEALRANGFAGRITMVGAEGHLPYERPQLSKAMLATADTPLAYMRQASDWRDKLGVDVVTDARLVSGDAERRVVATAAGRAFSYDRLLLATGTQPRRLAVLENSPIPVQYLRDANDALRLRLVLRDGLRNVIVGGGVIGLEAACAAAKHGCAVTVVEAEQSLLARAFPKIVSERVAAHHRAHGVGFVFGVTVAATSESGVTLSNGAVLAADLVLVGIGVEVDTTLPQALGLDAHGGIAVDARGQSAHPDVFCAGDLALQRSRCHGRALRIETWANAQNQAACTAGNMVGVTKDYDDPPWFWTDQYDLNIQIVGDMAQADHVLRGDPVSGRYSIAAIRAGEIVGALSVNAAKDMAMFRRMVAARRHLAAADIASPAYDLRKALAA